MELFSTLKKMKLVPICSIVNQIWLLPSMHCLYCFVFSYTQQLTVGQMQTLISN